MAVSISAPRPDGSPAVGRVRLRTLIAIRWIAVAGQAAAIVIVHFGLGYPLPLLPAALAVAASAAVNIWATAGRRGAGRLSDRAVAAYLGYDLLQLAALLYLTGGLHNPFAMLILAPITVSATVLSRFSTALLSALAVALVIGLSIAHLPLPWPAPGFGVASVFVGGLALALMLSVVFLAGYVFSVAEEARRMSTALAAAYQALDREHRVAALGALAAAAAHRLGSPLGTIAVVARELARDVPGDSPLRPDIDLLLSESERCRTILTGLSTRPEDGEPPPRLPVAALIETAAAPYLRPDIRLTVDAAPDTDHGGGEAGLSAAATPELLHGLGNLLQNAIEFARAEVRVTVRWTARRVAVTIRDDGPGIAANLLDQLGEPYLSGGVQGRPAKAEPMGLGVFIAQTLLGRTGAVLRFDNVPGGGGQVIVGWDRATWDRLARRPDGPS